ncbi:hypothetical protein [Nocardia veterana]|uniref:Sigma 54 modulation/S30EA-like ribosomal protein n=1 Tax=Nocardia veterana TaxID=132249 RepID=A0A7X6LYW2_9NOCA|nr:hypothetical protein [Nocardia veterana]
MQFDALMFNDVNGGFDAVVYRAGTSNFVDPAPAGALHFARQAEIGAVGSDIAPLPPPYIEHAAVLEETVAMQQLCHRGLPFLFFSEPCRHRGRLLYRRYDGNLGIVIPVGPGADE